MTALIVAFLLGAACTGVIVWQVAGYMFRAAAVVEIEKYRQRWLDALELMNSEGQITDEQIKTLTIEVEEQVEVVGPDTPIDGLSLRQLRNMSSYYRYELEKARAEDGLPQRDDLEGMSNFYITEVQLVHRKHRKRRAKAAARAHELEMFSEIDLDS